MSLSKRNTFVNCEMTCNKLVSKNNSKKFRYQSNERTTLMSVCAHIVPLPAVSVSTVNAAADQY